MANNRDNFSKADIKALRDRVSNICSKPSCRGRTVAAHSSDNKKSIITGKAAHICAASPKGPRYDSNMSPEERKSIDNGIWLCAIHADEIDKDDEEKYSEKVLKEWKLSAERESRNELGERLPHKDDSINLLTTSLTGHPVSTLSNAVHNVCTASSKVLEGLDPRFTINTSYIDGKTITEIKAKETVEVIMTINADYLQEYKKGYSKLLEHGESMKIDPISVSFKGSDLFRKISENYETLEFSKSKLSGTQKLWAINQETNELDVFDDFLGDIAFGSKSFSFSGYACDKLLFINTCSDVSGTGDLSLVLNTEIWNGKDIRKLPFFKKLLSFFTKVEQGWLICTSLESRGECILKTKGITLPKKESFLSAINLLNYTASCQVISSRLDKVIPYNSEVDFSLEEHRELMYVSEIFMEAVSHSLEHVLDGYIARCEVISDANGENLKPYKEAITIKITEPKVNISVFDMLVELPVKVSYFSNVKALVVNESDGVSEGDKVIIDWLPQEGFTGITVYET